MEKAESGLFLRRHGCRTTRAAYPLFMSAAEEIVVLSIPRALAPELPALSQGLTDRMHALLERNTEGALTATEREELETLVEMAQFAQILATDVQGAQGG